MSDGFYSKLNKRIKQLKQDGHIVITCDELADYIRPAVSGTDREIIDDKCSKAMAAVALYQNACRSFCRGKGVYVDTESLNSPYVYDKLIANAGESQSEKEKVKLALEAIKSEKFPDVAQIDSSFGFDKDGNPLRDENGDLLLIDAMTKEDIIEMLIAIVDKAVGE